jgi:hypothetical protein
MCHTAKRFKYEHLVPTCTVKRFVQYMPHDTYLNLNRTDGEPICCQQALFGNCSQCNAVRMHAVKMWSSLRGMCAHGHSVAGRNILDALVNDVLDLHLHMQLDGDYEPVYAGHSIAQAHFDRAAWSAQLA